jgi:hypothetical protein
MESEGRPIRNEGACAAAGVAASKAMQATAIAVPRLTLALTSFVPVRTG